MMRERIKSARKGKKLNRGRKKRIGIYGRGRTNVAATGVWRRGGGHSERARVCVGSVRTVMAKSSFCMLRLWHDGELR